MLYPACLARNHMVTHVLAKTTKLKNNFINGKKKFKRILSCLFAGRRKVQVKNLLPKKNTGQHFHVDRHLVMGKEIRSKINDFNWCQRSWPSGITLACQVGRADSQRGHEFFLFISFSFFFF